MSTTNGSSRPLTRRHRVAAVLAALGTLIMASGLVVLSAPSASATTTLTWTGQGSGNLPCDGTVQWNFTNGAAVGPVLHVEDETFQPTSKTGNVYKFHTSGAGLSTNPLTAVSVVYDGPAGGELTISHCDEGPPPPPYDECPELSGDQPQGFDCEAPKDEVEERVLTGAPDCEAGTITTETQQRTRSYTWDGDSFEPGAWSEWQTVKTVVVPVGEGECVPYDECPELDGDQPEGTDCVAPADEVDQRTVTQDPDCEAGTVTTLFQERTRSYTWNGESFEPGPWSEWETVETSVEDVTEEQCPQGEEVEVPDAPVPAAPDCDTDGSLVLPADDEAFAWTVVRDGGADAGAGPYGPGVYDVTVESLLGEFVGGGTTRTFEDVTVLAATGEGDGCVLGVEEIAPAVTFTDPTCAQPGAAAWSGELTEVVDYTASRPAKAGKSVTVTAAIKPGLEDEFAFADGVQTVFTHAYPSLEDLECVKGVESFAPSPKPDAERPPTVLGTQAAVPTAVDAGLAGTGTRDAASPAGVVGQLLVAGGLLLLLAGGWLGLGRRDRGAHAA